MLEAKLVDTSFTKTVKVEDMLPMQIGVVCDHISGLYVDNIVMRTQSEKNIEVMNLSNPKNGRCWSGNVSGFSVKLLPENYVITLTQTE
jgi:hypothetical protein